MGLPTSLTGRIQVLDVLRGICVLGILLANIVAFSLPAIGPEIGFPHPFTEAEKWLEAFRQWLVAGKFRGMLCILFGVGMALQYQKVIASTPPGQKPNWPGTYLKRTLLLGTIGAFHGLFLWFGDILFMYACVALAAMWMMGIETAKLWKIIAGLATLSLLMGLVFGALTAFAGSEPMVPTTGNYIWLTPERETWAYQQGAYLVQFLYRAGMFTMAAMNVPFVGINLLALFLFGVVLQREGILRNPSEHPKFLKATLAVGLVAFALNAVPVIALQAGFRGDLGNLIEIGLSLFYAGPLIVGLAWLFEKTARLPLWKPLQNVGRVALTTYLSQTVICTTIFYSYGFALFGKLDLFQMLYVVAGVWLFNLVFAAVWLRFFDIGPVEWLWRSLVAGKKLPWKKPAPSPVQEGPPPTLA